MGDGADTFFWHDSWLGGVPMGMHFRRLFELAVDKSCTVSPMSALGWEVRARRGRGRGGGVVGLGGGYVRGCVTLLHSVSLQFNVTDSWRWQLDLIGSYSVRSAYQLLTS